MGNKQSFAGDLRASILQAAIQGRLTSRQAGDGDAHALLGEIRKEKEKLIKEKKIKKQKPLPPITEGEIPWEILSCRILAAVHLQKVILRTGMERFRG